MGFIERQPGKEEALEPSRLTITCQAGFASITTTGEPQSRPFWVTALVQAARHLIYDKQDMKGDVERILEDIGREQ